MLQNKLQAATLLCCVINLLLLIVLVAITVSIFIKQDNTRLKEDSFGAIINVQKEWENYESFYKGCTGNYDPSKYNGLFK